MSLRRKLLLLVVLPVVLCTSIAVVLSSVKIYNQGIHDLKDKSNAILALNILEFANHHVDGNSVTELNKKEALIGVTSTFNDESQNYNFRISSPDPLNEKHKASKQELEFINQFDSENLNELTFIDEDKNNLWVMRPVYMDKTKGCTDCHDGGSSASGNNLRGVFLVESDMGPIEREVKSSILQTSLVGFVIMIVAVFISVLVVRRITNAVIQIRNASQKVAEGNLHEKVTINTNDELQELGGFINQMLTSLNSVISSVKTAADDLNLATNDMNAASQSIAEGANEQMVKFQELNASIDGTANNIIDASGLIEKSEKHAGDAESGMQNTILSINKIQESANKVYAEVQTINNIAYQTKILAINASIEAARAGEHGKGFAVVANEVQKLSEITTKSSREIDEVTAISLSQVDEGVKVAENAGKQIKEIIKMVSDISASLQSISTHANDQAQIAGQNNAITQSNAASAEELSNAASSLQDQANSLLQAISYFETKNE